MQDVFATRYFRKMLDRAMEPRCRRRYWILSIGLHLLENGDDHVEARSLRRVLVHANLDQARHVRWYSRWNRDAQILQRHLVKQITVSYVMKLHWNSLLAFIPISIGERSAKGTSRVDSSHRTTAYDHMSAAFWFRSSGLRWSATSKMSRSDS